MLSQADARRAAETVLRDAETLDATITAALKPFDGSALALRTGEVLLDCARVTTYMKCRLRAALAPDAQNVELFHRAMAHAEQGEIGLDTPGAKV